MSAEYDFLFEDIEDELTSETTDAPGQVDAEVEAERERAAQTAAAEAQERALQAEVARYIDLLPEIQSARPLPAQVGGQESEAPRLSGAAWIADRLHKAIEPVAPAGTRITTGVVGTTVAATVIPPAGVKGRPLASAMLAAIEAAGNLGSFEVKRAGGSAFTLRRDGVGAETDAWTRHGAKAGRFYSDPEYRVKVWDAAGLSVPGSAKGMKRRPKCAEFGEDSRGATVELRLPDGLTIANVERARAALRQSLNAPSLQVGERGVHPVLSLNTKAIERSLPALALLRPEMLVRPRTEAERYAAAKDFVIPFGVRVAAETGAAVPILVNQDTSPHSAVMGKSGSGKTVLLSQIVKAAVVQGAEVILWDGKQGKDLRALAKQRLPGVVHYDSGASFAALHRTLQFLRDEFDRRKALAEILAQRDIEYRPTPLLAVLDELPAWLVDLKRMKGEAEKAALRTESRLNYIASQARELRIFFVVAGQYAYVDGYPGMIRTNTSTLVSLGVPEDINMANLFSGNRRRAEELAATITKKDKGVGVVVDSDTNEPELFRGVFNPPGPDADRFDEAVRQAPKQRRWAYRLPRGDEPGADGSWADWNPVSNPSSDSLPARWLDDEHGRPIPEAEIDDPTSTAYRPGRRRLPDTHLI